MGNGVMDFQDHSLDKSAAQYMFQHSLIANRLEYIYSKSCERDYTSPRCRFVQYEIGVIEAYLNRYSMTLITQISIKLAREHPLKHSGSKRHSPTNAQREKTGSFHSLMILLLEKSLIVRPITAPSSTGI